MGALISPICRHIAEICGDRSGLTHCRIWAPALGRIWASCAPALGRLRTEVGVQCRPHPANLGELRSHPAEFWLILWTKFGRCRPKIFALPISTDIEQLLPELAKFGPLRVKLGGPTSPVFGQCSPSSGLASFSLHCGALSRSDHRVALCRLYRFASESLTGAATAYRTSLAWHTDSDENGCIARCDGGSQGVRASPGVRSEDWARKGDGAAVKRGVNRGNPLLDARLLATTPVAFCRPVRKASSILRFRQSGRDRIVRTRLPIWLGPSLCIPLLNLVFLERSLRTFSGNGPHVAQLGLQAANLARSWSIPGQTRQAPSQLGRQLRCTSPPSRCLLGANFVRSLRPDFHQVAVIWTSLAQGLAPFRPTPGEIDFAPMSAHLGLCSTETGTHPTEFGPDWGDSGPSCMMAEAESNYSRVARHAFRKGTPATPASSTIVQQLPMCCLTVAQDFLWVGAEIRPRFGRHWPSLVNILPMFPPSFHQELAELADFRPNLGRFWATLTNIGHCWPNFAALGKLGQDLANTDQFWSTLAKLHQGLTHI